MAMIIIALGIIPIFMDILIRIIMTGGKLEKLERWR